MNRAGRLWVAMLLGVAPYLAAGDDAMVRSSEQGGIAIELSYQALHDGNGLTRITLSDAKSGRPVEGARPAAWMLARRSEQVSEELSCEVKARTLQAGSLGARADVDLNGYRLVTLNQDDTVAFINPHVGLQNSKLESIVQLPGTGYDWLALPQTQRLFVTLREAGAVAVIDSSSRRLLGTVATGDGSQPTRLVADPDGSRVWVGLDGESRVLALDSHDGHIVSTVAAGDGLHTLTSDDDLSWIGVTNSRDNSVSLIDRQSLAVRTVKTPQTPVAIAWSGAAQRLAVLSINAGTLSLIDPVSGDISARVDLQAGVETLGLFDDGRYALVLNGQTDRLSLIDLATARLVSELDIPGHPDHLSFSHDFAYVRSQGSADMRLINLAQARQGKLVDVSIPMGRGTAAQVPQSLNVASPMARAPEGNGMLVANPADGMLYRYVEGMMVPVGSFSNYRRQARGLMVLDSSLSERQPGRFEAATRIERTGRYDVVVRNLQPSITACFVLSLEGAPVTAPHEVAPVPTLLSVSAENGQVALIQFKLGGADRIANDVTLLAVQRQGTGQTRSQATYLGEGRYSATLRGLRPGRFELLVRAPALGTGFDHGRLGTLQWPLDLARDRPLATAENRP
ncbi:MAG TPA: YncE family protein [Pseudomonas sp.]|uniref:YncE family protein n=1 Tax=Pseudomonas sp. TaxID=306 RepID=UPI002ED8684C